MIETNKYVHMICAVPITISWKLILRQQEGTQLQKFKWYTSQVCVKRIFSSELNALEFISN